MFHLKNFLDPSQDGIYPIQDGLSFYVRNSFEVVDQVKGYIQTHKYELDTSYYVDPVYYLEYVLNQIHYNENELTENHKKELVNWIDSYING